MFDYPEIITVWNELTNDGVGRKTWARFSYPARIAYKTQKFTDKNGDSTMSTAVCYSDGANLTIDSKVLFEESTEAEPTSKADEVRLISQIPSGAGDMKKAWFS